LKEVPSPLCWDSCSCFLILSTVCWSKPGAQLLSCQYVYSCTSKASKEAYERLRLARSASGVSMCTLEPVKRVKRRTWQELAADVGERAQGQHSHISALLALLGLLVQEYAYLARACCGCRRASGRPALLTAPAPLAPVVKQ
jgi:hypothetical protein